ncbi:hypothetical protein LIER_07896 [Lithospermum erythrorhizon]|uniref:Pectinesterase inhibitor domain-containing protein n=1 Tax=Lithospermum erythrorhizon TaxID=34254 RepID=A0AAV3PA87_LITER
MVHYYITKNPTFFLVLAWLTCSCSSWSSRTSNPYVRQACSVTLYQQLCIRSLSPFSSAARNHPTRWARAGVSVSIGEAKNVVAYLAKARKRNPMRGRNRIALSDCVECIQDSLDNLHKSLGVLRKLSTKTFNTQMGDVITWLSAALTDGDTCLDGFEESKEQVNTLRRKVMNVTHITSNALAIVNKLATTGPQALLVSP